jgi:hypothetical protein
MKTAPLSAAVIASLFVTACSSTQVDTRVTPGASFEGLRSYSWLMISDSAGAGEMPANPLMRQRLIRAVDSELAAKGYERIESDADFLVSYYAFTQQQIQWDAFDATTRYLGGMPIMRNEWNQGTLVLIILDPDRNRVQWLGWADDAVDPTRPDKMAEMINNAVTKILAEFPPES